MSATPFQPWRGVFETLRVERGRALFVEAHWQSLGRACAALGLRAGEDFRRAAPGLPPGEDGRWRWVVDAANGGREFFQPEPLPRPGRGLALTLATVRVGSRNLDARFKTLSYLTHWQARQENPRGETLLPNEHGHLASGAMSNVFWVRGGELWTPAEECGCRAGVVRGWVLGQAGAVVREVRAGPETLDAAEEIFLTNSMWGVCPVRSWSGRALPAPGPVTRRLRRLYRRACREDGR